MAANRATGERPPDDIRCEETVRPVRFLNPSGEDRYRKKTRLGGDSPETDSFLKGLILAQNERWRRGLGMQVERAARPVAEG